MEFSIFINVQAAVTTNRKCSLWQNNILGHQSTLSFYNNNIQWGSLLVPDKQLWREVDRCMQHFLPWSQRARQSRLSLFHSTTGPRQLHWLPQGHSGITSGIEINSWTLQDCVSAKQYLLSPWPGSIDHVTRLNGQLWTLCSLTPCLEWKRNGLLWKKLLIHKMDIFTNHKSDVNGYGLAADCSF